MSDRQPSRPTTGNPGGSRIRSDDFGRPSQEATEVATTSRIRDALSLAGPPRPAPWLLLVLLLGFAIRFAAIDFQSLWRDEIDAGGFGPPGTRIGEVLASGDLRALAQTLTQREFNGPLYFIVLQQWTHVAGDSAFALRFPSALFGALAVPMIYIVARRLLRGT